MNLGAYIIRTRRKVPSAQVGIIVRVEEMPVIEQHPYYYFKSQLQVKAEGLLATRKCTPNIDTSIHHYDS